METEGLVEDKPSKKKNTAERRREKVKEGHSNSK